MPPTIESDDPSEPRFPDVSRRAFLRRSAVIGLAATAVPVLAACGGTSSTTVRPNATPANGGATSAEPATTQPLGTTGSSSDLGASAAGTTSATDSPAPATRQAGSTGSQLQINFTYEADGGRVHSPYIAVWIEDPAGDLVQTVSLWYKSDESKYLRDLKRWSSKNNSAALTTGATRIPGSFAVAWDGTELDGAAVDAGDYFVCIEAAREDGPYQLIRELVAVSETLTPTPLTPNGELTAASVELIT